MPEKNTVLQVVVLIVVMACSGFASAIEDTAVSQSRPQHGGAPDQVFFLIYVIDIDEISGQKQSFVANLALRMRWKDERLVHDGSGARTLPLNQVWNPRVILANRQARLRSVMPEVVTVRPDGTVLYRQQYLGPLSQPLYLADFPRDTQDFNIHFVAVGYDPEEIHFVPDDVLGTEHLTGGGLAETLSLPDWEILRHKIEARPYVVSGGFLVAGFALEFVAKRYFGYYWWQVIVPLILIVMMSWAPFWVDPAKAELQFGIASSTVLTLIAYRFLLASLVPKLAYMTRLDYVSLGGTVLVFVAFLQVLLTSVLGYSGRRKEARLLDVWCRVVFPIVFAAILFWSLIVPNSVET